jgi:outer membrane lipoprotein-sorting protein
VNAARPFLCGLCALCVVSACGAPLLKLPAGPGAPAADAAAALTQATAVCRGIRTLSAEVAASGKVSGQRFRARLSVGVAEPASARIEAVAPFGAPYFILAAKDDDATLLLPRDERVLEHGRAAEVLDAVAGVPLGAGDLHALLTGCAPALSQPEQGRELGADWRMIADTTGDALYLRRTGAGQPWALAAVIRPAWRAEYREPLNGLPRAVRITSTSAAGDPGASFDLTLALSQVETNVPLGAEVFRVDIPRAATPITLEELRRARPGVRKN